MAALFSPTPLVAWPHRTAEFPHPPARKGESEPGSGGPKLLGLIALASA